MAQRQNLIVLAAERETEKYYLFLKDPARTNIYMPPLRASFSQDSVARRICGLSYVPQASGERERRIHSSPANDDDYMSKCVCSAAELYPPAHQSIAACP